jgi:hypothetical protein
MFGTPITVCITFNAPSAHFFCDSTEDKASDCRDEIISSTDLLLWKHRLQENNFYIIFEFKPFITYTTASMNIVVYISTTVSFLPDRVLVDYQLISVRIDHRRCMRSRQSSDDIGNSISRIEIISW